MDFNNLYTSGNRKSLQVNCLLSFGLVFSNVCARPEFMTAINYDSVCCIYVVAWSSRLLMTLVTSCHHTCVLVFMPVMNILNIFCDYQFVFCVLDELCFTLRLGLIPVVNQESMKYVV